MLTFFLTFSLTFSFTTPEAPDVADEFGEVASPDVFTAATPVEDYSDDVCDGESDCDDCDEWCGEISPEAPSWDGRGDDCGPTTEGDLNAATE